MTLVDEIAELQPVIKEKYLAEYQEEVKLERQMLKKPIPEHEWWREYIEEEEPEVEIDPITGSIILLNIMFDLGDNFEANKEILRDFFLKLEAKLYNLSKDELGEVEDYFFDSLLIRYERHQEIVEKLLLLMGPKSKKLCTKLIKVWGYKINLY